MARLVKEGNEVYTLILGEGITSRDEKRDRAKRERELKVLKNQTVEANKILGVKKTYTFDFPDNRFDTISLLDIIKVIERTKEEVKPEVIFTHHHGDLNVDHQVTLKAVMTAFRPVKEEKAREIYSFEVPSSTEWNTPSCANCFRPNYFVNISETLEVKIKAMKEYKSEVEEFPHPRSPEAIELMAKCWGVQVGLSATEAFEVVRLIRT